MSNDTLARASALINAYNAGESAAQRLQIGETFFGADAAAFKAGIVDDAAARRLFIEGFLRALPLVTTDKRGTILSLTNR